jgi:hypothetical protein
MNLMDERRGRGARELVEMRELDEPEVRMWMNLMGEGRVEGG